MPQRVTAMLIFWLLTFAIFTLRAALLPEPFEFLSLRRLLTTAAGAIVFGLATAMLDQASAKSRRTLFRLMFVALVAGSAAAFVVRLLGSSFEGGIRHADLLENARWTLLWSGYFSAALVAYLMLSPRQQAQSDTAAEEPRPAPTTNAEEEPALWMQSHGANLRVPVSMIEWIESEGNYVRVHTQAASGLIRVSLAKLEQKLEPSAFLRVHRSAICATRHIMSVRRSSNGFRIVLKSGAELPVGRKYADRVKAIWSPGEEIAG